MGSVCPCFVTTYTYPTSTGGGGGA